MKTGKDVFGRSYPYFFQSFDVNQPGLQVYLAIPAIYFLGLNEFSARLAPAILGAITPILFYFLTRLMFPKQISISYLAAILMTFAPWNIAISRAQFVTIEVIFLYLLFFVLFFVSLAKNIKLLPIAFLVLAITIYAYHSALISLPLIIILVTLAYWKQLKKHKRLLILSIILVFIALLPAAIYYQQPSSRSRFNTVSIFIPDVTLPTSIAEIEHDRANNLPFANLLHNRRFIYANTALDTYFDYFNPDYLFVNSKGVRYFYLNDVGLFYLIELPFVAYGVYHLLRRKSEHSLFILGLLMIGPVPGMVALGSQFAHRAPLLLVAIQLTSALGLYNFLKKRNATALLVLIIYSLSFYHFTHQYFIHSPKEFTSEFDNGAWFSTVRDVIPKVNSLKGNYDKVVFTWSQYKLVPPVYFLFYNQIDPRILQTKAAGWTNEPPSFRQIYTPQDNIEFRKINWEQDKKLKNTLFVGYPNEFGEDAKIVDKTYLPNGKLHFLIVGN